MGFNQRACIDCLVAGGCFASSGSKNNGSLVEFGKLEVIVSSCRTVILPSSEPFQTRGNISLRTVSKVIGKWVDGMMALSSISASIAAASECLLT